MARKTAKKVAKPAPKAPKAGANITLNDVMILLDVAKEVLDHYEEYAEPMTPPAHLFKLGAVIQAVRGEIETFGAERVVTDAERIGNFGTRGCSLC